MINTIDTQVCVSCGICIEVCMKDVLRFDESTSYPIIQYFEDCQTCFNCELLCPSKAIFVHPLKREAVRAW